jgi:hypothetical protein
VLEAGGCVPLFVVKELLRHMEDRIIADKTINAKLKQLSAENKLEIISERIKIEMYPAINNGKKQCTVIRKKGHKESGDPKFNWGLVSNIPFSIPARGDYWISEDNLIFGVKNAVEDDIESDFDFEAEEMSVRYKNFEKSWEES